MKRVANIRSTYDRARGRSLSSSLAIRVTAALLLCLSLTLSGCFQENEGEPYYGRVTTPRAQEFRWSDGGLPQTFDPALAAAPPDTDAVRAMFEGLTDYDPQTLSPVPGVASRWESSEDRRVWTFYLRRDARWSNGDAVTANDFVRSWQRTLGLGTRAPHAHLLENIVGASVPAVTVSSEQPAASPPPTARRTQEKSAQTREPKKETAPAPPAFGVEALNDYTLRVQLQEPDQNFPSLVAHPIFRPVHAVRDEDGATVLSEPIVSNGPFRLTQVAGDGVILERASSYWDAQTVNLSRVRFIPSGSAEEALEKYRAGDVDVVTNAGFEPLALKLLAPYKDFRRATYGALTYYKFNTERAPFNDLRVREALAIAIDRERISEDEMDGASEPAKTFLPTQSTESSTAQAASTPESAAISQDIARARSLLAEAGFPQGAGFPRIRLLVNRNEQQRQIAQAVAAMWRRSLGVETDVLLKPWDEYEAAVRSGDYDVVRRGMVMQTMDETANIRAMFAPDDAPEAVEDPALAAQETAVQAARGTKDEKGNKGSAESPALLPPPLPRPITSQAEALKELPAIPIYFASSYTLVKPYVVGFDNNLLDAPSLKRVRLDTTWQAPKRKEAVWFRVGD
ncbi:MAG: peptide ABC transporter substrate-binding protein [Acidobacteria bacterium]|nr:peptide ABC transporter substrate-binding protein [Acidobacteriota bacterium]